MVKRLFAIPLMIVLVVGLVFGGCAAPVPAPAPIPAPVAPVPAPTHEPVTVELYTNPVGGPMYILGFALADLTNKHSDWLTITALETASAYENLRTMKENYAEKKNSMMGEVTTVTWDMSTAGMKPFKEPWKQTKWIAPMFNISSPMVTLDPNIKTWRDLPGKRWGLDTMGSTNQYVPEMLMEYWGIRDQVKVDYGCTNEIGVDRILDGTLDITWTGALVYGPEEYKDWQPTPFFEKLLSQKQAYFMELTEEDMAGVREKSGLLTLGLMGAKARTVGKSDCAQWKGIAVCIGWVVPEDMDDAIVTEITRIIYEYADMFESYHAMGRAIARGTMGQLPVSREEYHPAAAKYLESKGLKVGR